MRLPLPAGYYKHTLIYSWASVAAEVHGKRRSGGWSESYFAPVNQYEAPGTPMVNLENARLAMLPTGVTQAGRRVIDMSAPNSPLHVNNTVYSSTWAIESDIPQMAALVTGRSVQGNQLKMELRGVPDFYVQSGQYVKKTGLFEEKLEYFLSKLSGFGQLVRNLKAASQDIHSITSGGLVTLIGALPGAVKGTPVFILRSIVGGRRRGVLTLIRDDPVGNTFQLMDWPHGASKGGKMRLAQIQYAQYVPANMKLQGVVTRKVGKVPFSFVGKRSNRA